MPRPKSERLVHEPPLFVEFKPTGIAARLLDPTQLSLDEFEAVRLADYVGMSHEEAAAEMDISRSTFTRLIDQARKKVATFLIKGQILSIGGGMIHFRNNIIRCLSCGFLFRIQIGQQVNSCPECQSVNLENLAGGHGHGACCR